MENIKPNEYVRTMDGKIGVFVRYSSRKDDSLYKSPANCFVRLNKRKSDLQCFRDYIKKHSKNIIDLIEKDDFINGWQVADFLLDPISKERKYAVTMYGNFAENEIETILTKELFEANCYKVKEEIC